MDGPKHGVELTEPEKQILLGPDFIVRANKLLAKEQEEPENSKEQGKEITKLITWCLLKINCIKIM